MMMMIMAVISLSLFVAAGTTAAAAAVSLSFGLGILLVSLLGFLLGGLAVLFSFSLLLLSSSLLSLLPQLLLLLEDGLHLGDLFFGFPLFHRQLRPFILHLCAARGRGILLEAAVCLLSIEQLQGHNKHNRTTFSSTETDKRLIMEQALVALAKMCHGL